MANKNRLDLRTAIRNKMKAWPDDQTTLAAAITTATATSTTLTSGTRLSDRCLLQIDSEVIQCRTFVTATGVVSSMVRGARGTTAAAHSNGATVYIFPDWGWTDTDVNNAIDAAIYFIRPEVWYWKTYENTLLATYNEFGMPTGVVYPSGEQIKQVEFLDADGITWVPVHSWSHKGDRLMFDKALSKTKTARIKTCACQPILTDDTTVIESNEYAEVLVLYAAAQMLEDLVGNRVRYLEYSAVLNDRASTPDELQRTAYYFRNQAITRKDILSRPFPSGFASARRRV